MEELVTTLWYISASMIEIFLLYYFFHSFEKRKDDKWRGFCCYFFLVATDLILNYFQFNSNLKLIIIFITLNIILRMLYRISLKRLLFLTAVFLLLFVLSEFVTFAILDLLNKINDINLIQSNLLINIEGTLIARSINLLLLVIANRMLRKRSAEISISELAITLLPCFTNVAVIFFIVDFTNMFNNSTQGSSKNMLIVFITGMLFLSSASLLLIFEKYLKNKEKQKKSELMEQQTKDLLKYFSEKEIVDERIKKMYHDMKNHILCLEKLALDSNNCKDYIEAIKDTLSGYENYIATGNRALDILINEKTIKMRHLNIKFSCTINLTGIDFIKDIDFITIFSNAIDNAIEACEKADENQRYIKMNSTYAGQFLTIKICNYISREVLFEGHTVKTSKADPFYHGIGLANIKKSVSKYKGEVNFDITKDEFKMIIVIPMKEKPGFQNG